MNLGWKHLAGQLLNGADLSKASLDEIDILLDEYPYFAGLHFLKAVKLKSLQTEEHTADFAKAALYFPNPHWFSLMLAHSVPESVDIEPAPEPFETVVNRDDHEETVQHIQPAEDVAESTAHQLTSTEDEPITEIQEQPAQPDWEQTLAENPVFQQHQVSDEEQIEQEIWHQQATERETEAPIEEITSSPVEIIEEAGILETEFPSSDLPEDPLMSVEAETSVAEENFHIEPEPEIELPIDEPAPVEEPVSDHIPEPEAAPEQDTVPIHDQETTKPAEPVADDLGIPFEPLYTIDYFASQGIKIAAEASPKDQLSLKLRSFTEWLRAMKKLHPEKIDKVFNQDQEEQVRVIAESSNAPQIVYTEAMAEVFIKQGKKDKARQVFEKLSLLDPAKSAYFAVRIKELKEN
jgi:hypothetical protein